MGWPEAILNPKHLAALYDEVRGLDRLSLHEISVDREGPCLRIRGDLPRFPDRPSTRWPREANRAQVVLVFIGVTELVLAGAATVVEGMLEVVTYEHDKLRFAFSSDTVRFHGLCGHVRLESVSGYAVGKVDDK
jgi:hypothetical protein